MTDSLIGRTLAHYRITHRLGSGGMGVVYAARDLRLDRAVAIKILMAPDRTGRDHLLHEARAASALTHPHVAAIYAVEEAEAEGVAFIVMELVEGETLSAILARRALTADAVIRYGVHIADAVAHAHKHRVIHCDLKSHNVIVTGDGRAKVLDFGVARRLPPDEIDALTTRDAMPEGSTGGTLSVMAPEVLAGSSPDARSDIWSLGVLLYEMASGRLPFTGATGFALTAAILQQEPPKLPESVPASVRRAIAACLVKDPAARCQHAGEIRAMLENTAPAAGAATASSRRVAPRLAIAAVLVVLAMAAAAVFYWDRLRGPAGGPIESLAVLPLQNLSGDKDQEYFADGMTDALITELAQISQLKVISRTSVMQYKDAKQPLPEIGRALNVDAIVEGSIRRSGDRVAISVQLLRASTDASIWADTYEEELRDVLALHRKVARAISDRVRSRIASPAIQALPRADSLDPKAYEAYVRGRFFWNRRTSDSLRTAIQYFNQALEHDPAYAPAHSGLADSHFYLGYVFGRVPPREAMPRARQAADTALRLDPNVGEAHASAGLISMIYDWDRPAAERSFKQAIALNRNYATAYHGYAALLATWGGRGDEAVAMIRRGLETDPLSLPVNHMAGLVLSLAGRSDEAIAQLGRTLEMEPGYGISRGVLASEYERRGKHAQAFAERQWLKQQAGADPDLLKRFEETYKRGGIVAYRELDLKRAIENWDGWHGSAWDIAVLSARLGHAELAFDWLDRTVEMRSGMVVWLPTAPEYANLRTHPRYQAALRRIAAPPS